ncbi:AfsR/SARP family transcriptional regulator [Streptomyces durbertensis]|uniref:AfsR/SARP family transcriptional regulator n=1 Tax=Streptomyces durbertensis TaxID=2448886 RepID=A0ABR6EBM3_9ACTN|nr:AfsR/SARP family transcriptional regulator [Streptomyces durbertensis]MBB1242739.1 AfsR/SARP family transcriptional regulator [Streptomyces durbertensis]
MNVLENTGHTIPKSPPRVEILGPLIVRSVDSAETGKSVGGVRVRTLLAVLAASLGQTITTERILKEVWADNPPATARKAVAVAVLRLRRVLDDPAGGWLVTHPSGYALEIPPDNLDALRAERLVREGKAALGAGDPQAASRYLTRALAQWRGEPYADTTATTTVLQRANELSYLRSEAVQVRIEADLALGRHRELVGELRSLTAAQPLHEPHWLQLMLALYRSGKQAEALAVYGQLQRTLAEKLGVDPGRQLQELHLQMLRADAELLSWSECRPYQSLLDRQAC